MPETVDELALELRSAVLANDHENAARVSAEYTQAVRQHWMQLSPQGRVASHLPKQAIELLNWVREMTIVQQALAAQQLATVERASRYQNARSLYQRFAALGTQD